MLPESHCEHGWRNPLGTCAAVAACLHQPRASLLRERLPQQAAIKAGFVNHAHDAEEWLVSIIKRLDLLDAAGVHFVYVIARVITAVADWPPYFFSSNTRTLNLKVPVWSGVPKRTPAQSKWRPGGNAPAVTQT